MGRPSEMNVNMYSLVALMSDIPIPKEISDIENLSKQQQPMHETN